MTPHLVIPAQAGISLFVKGSWTAASAGVTVRFLA
jgi:hypothetical protein